MCPSERKRGSVLIIAMVILFAITALVLTLNRQARVQAQAAANDLAAQQADSIERGAEQYALSLLTDYRTTLNQLTDQDFAAVPVGTGYFWIVKPTYGDDTQSGFGLMDESSKINLNTVTAAQLAAVPGMTEDIAGAIVDWVDADDTLRPNGAETSTYAGLSTPYNAKNADFDSVDEMLLLNGMTKQLLYGDPAAASSSGQDYYLSHGLADYFTVWSAQSTLAADQTTRANLLDASATGRQALQTILQNKLGAARGQAVFNQVAPGFPPGIPPVTDILMLADRANLTEDEFQSIEDFVVSFPVSQSTTQPTGASTGARGLINFNTASREVLMTLTAIPTPTPLNESDIDALIAARPGAGTTNSNSMAWILGAITAKNKLDGLGNYITGSGSQYSADIISASGNGRGFRQVKVVIDTTTTPPHIIYRHDITDRGWPLDPQVLASLKSGQGITEGATQGASLVSGGQH